MTKLMKNTPIKCSCCLSLKEEGRLKKVSELVHIGYTNKGSDVWACPHCDGSLADRLGQTNDS
jgi:hypothetical protein